MNKDSLVTINITKQYNNITELLNPTGVSLLFYWDETTDLKESLKNDESLKQYIILKTFNIDNYASSVLNYFSFKYDENNNEIYYDNKINIQELFPLSEMKIENTMFIYDYLIKYFKILYTNAFKEQYENDIEVALDFDEIIRDIFNKIQEKYPNRFSIETLSNYIRMKLRNGEYLSEENVDWIVKKLQNIINVNNE